MTFMAPPLVQQINHVDSIEFEAGLHTLTSSLPASMDEAIGLFTEICDSLAASEILGPIERERRAGLILRKAPNDARFFRAIAGSASSWTPDVKNAVVAFLPAEFKPLVFGKRPGQAPGRTTVVAREATPAPLVEVLDDGAEYHPEVLLVGTAQEQESNHRHLERDGFRPRRASSLDEFFKLLTTDVVGVLVGRTWWALLPHAQHAAFVQELFQYSSFTWLKIDAYGCHVAASLFALNRDLRYREPAAIEVAIGDSSVINEIDVESLRNASQLIDNPTGIRLCPADIDPNQAKLLIAGISHHVKARHYPPTIRFEEIDTSTLQGGRSQTLIVSAQPDDGGLPYIAKLGDIPLLREEMRRFQCFIAPWDNLLNPRFHYHGKQGLIIFGLVGAADSPLQPAPTLEDTLRQALLMESGGVSLGVPSETDLRAFLQRTISKTESLNARQCNDKTFKSLAWIDTQSLDATLVSGVTWSLPPLRSGHRPLELRQAAVNILQKAAGLATIHGDMHLRNVLVRDGREPFLIDYAYSGPGHPCFDLVRLESALLFTIFRMTEDEATIRALLLALHDDGATLQSACTIFPALCSSIGNRLAIQVTIDSHQACQRLLSQYGLAKSEYYAMKLVIGCQSLAMPHLQAGIVRPAILAAAQLFEQALG